MVVQGRPTKHKLKKTKKCLTNPLKLSNRMLSIYTHVAMKLYKNWGVWYY